MRVTIGLILFCLVACGGDEGKTNPAIDAPAAAIDGPSVDAPTVPSDAATAVQEVPCAGLPMHPVVTAPGVYSPSDVTINVGEVVEFQMPSVHDVQPNATGSDPGIHVGFSQTRCKKFVAAGTYGFHCGPHQFTGTITVAP